jgi:outer membrane protein
MRLTRLVCLTALFVLVTGGLAAQSFEKVPAAPQAAPAASSSAIAGKIAIINVQGALLSTQEGQKGLQELQERFRPRQAELETLQQEVQDYQQRLQSGRRTLSQDAQLEIQREVEKRVKKGRRIEEDLTEESQAAQANLVNRISVKMRPIIGQYAEQKGLSLILPITQQGAPIFAAPGVDITQEIVQLYDQSNPVAAAAATPGN